MKIYCVKCESEIKEKSDELFHSECGFPISNKFIAKIKFNDMLIVYLAIKAKKLMGKKITEEQEKVFSEIEPELANIPFVKSKFIDINSPIDYLSLNRLNLSFGGFRTNMEIILKKAQSNV